MCRSRGTASLMAVPPGSAGVAVRRNGRERRLFCEIGVISGGAAPRNAFLSTHRPPGPDILSRGIGEALSSVLAIFGMEFIRPLSSSSSRYVSVIRRSTAQNFAENSKDVDFIYIYLFYLGTRLPSSRVMR